MRWVGRNVVHVARNEGDDRLCQLGIAAVVLHDECRPHLRAARVAERVVDDDDVAAVRLHGFPS
jgi:hypothetical protein